MHSKLLETSSSEQIIRDLAAIKTEFVIDDNESIFNSKQDANDNSIQEEIEQSDSNYASPTHFLGKLYGIFSYTW